MGVTFFVEPTIMDDTTYSKGKVGLWTKADSLTAFDDLTISQP